MPYFDLLFDALEQGHPDVTAAFERHIHWGYWDDPGAPLPPPDGLARGFAEAMERMCRRFLDVADIRPGQRVLDVGCGFGGTIASLVERTADLDVVGVNIDERQLARARRLVPPGEGRRVAFVHADACAMPFADGSFDRVIAVECIMHFESRDRFFREARRLLRPGGRLTLSDLLFPRWLLPGLKLLRRVLGGESKFLGELHAASLADYRALARAHGLRLDVEDDVTAHIMPTYDTYLSLLPRFAGVDAVGGALAEFRKVRRFSERRALRYRILSLTRD